MDGKMSSAAAVRQVSEWALLTARYFVVYFALRCADRYFPVPCNQSSFILRCDNLTDAEAALLNWMMWCAASQAAAAELALLLPSRPRRVRLALAYLALAVAIVGHCTHASAVCLLLAADPGYVFMRVVCPVAVLALAAGDLVRLLFLPLLLLGGEE